MKIPEVIVNKNNQCIKSHALLISIKFRNFNYLLSYEQIWFINLKNYKIQSL